MRFWVRAGRQLAGRPSLWPTAFVQVGRLAAPRWLRHAPFLPRPDPEYLRFRLETQYGAAAGTDRMEPHDLVAYLEWCRAVMPRPPRGGEPRG